DDGSLHDALPICVTVTVTVKQKSADPTSATATPSTICNGQSSTLALVGGGGGDNETIHWYSGSCGGTPVGSTVSPTTTTIYYGRYEDGAPCSYNSACASVTVTVKARPTAVVSGSTTICNGGSATASAALTGKGPWNVTWSDGTTTTVHTGVGGTGYTGTDALMVSPSSTKTYT